MQYSPIIRAARLADIMAQIGSGARLLLFISAKSADCTSADPQGLIATMTLPAVWLATPVISGNLVTVSIANGPWATTTTGSGTVLSFRIYNSALTVCGLQGTVSTVVDGTGDMLLTSNALGGGQLINIASFTITSGNA